MTPALARLRGIAVAAVMLVAPLGSARSEIIDLYYATPISGSGQVIEYKSKSKALREALCRCSPEVCPHISRFSEENAGMLREMGHSFAESDLDFIVFAEYQRGDGVLSLLQKLDQALAFFTLDYGGACFLYKKRVLWTRRDSPIGDITWPEVALSTSQFLSDVWRFRHLKRFDDPAK